MRSESDTRDGHGHHAWLKVVGQYIACASLLLLASAVACGRSTESGFDVEGDGGSGSGGFSGSSSGGFATGSSSGSFAGDGSVVTPQGVLAITPVARGQRRHGGSGTDGSIRYRPQWEGGDGFPLALDQGALGKLSGARSLHAVGDHRRRREHHRDLRGRDRDHDGHGEHPDDEQGGSRIRSESSRAGPGGYGGVGGNGPGAPPTSGAGHDAERNADGGFAVSSSIRTTAPSGRRGCSRRSCSGTRARTRSTRSTCTSQGEELRIQGVLRREHDAVRQRAHPAGGVDRDGVLERRASRDGLDRLRRKAETAYGPYTETWTIAQATLQGTIYYNSYGTALVKNSDPAMSTTTASSTARARSRSPRAPTRPRSSPASIASTRRGDGTGCAFATRRPPTARRSSRRPRTMSASSYDDRPSTSASPTTRRAAPGPPLGDQRTNLAFPALYKTAACSSRTPP